MELIKNKYILSRKVGIRARDYMYDFDTHFDVDESRSHVNIVRRLIAILSYFIRIG